MWRQPADIFSTGFGLNQGQLCRSNSTLSSPNEALLWSALVHLHRKLLYDENLISNWCSKIAHSQGCNMQQIQNSHPASLACCAFDWTNPQQGLYFPLLLPLFPTTLCESRSWLCSVWKQTLVDEFVEHSRCIHSHGVSASSMGSAAGKPGSARLYRCVILSTPTHTELKLDSMRIADGIVHLPALFLPRCFLTLPADNLLLSSLLAVLLGLSCRVTSLTQPPCVMSRWMGTEHT